MMQTDLTCHCPPTGGCHDPAQVWRYFCQACLVHHDHARCTGENTLGTHVCICVCPSSPTYNDKEAI